MVASRIGWNVGRKSEFNFQVKAIIITNKFFLFKKKFCYGPYTGLMKNERIQSHVEPSVCGINSKPEEISLKDKAFVQKKLVKEFLKCVLKTRFQFA